MMRLLDLFDRHRLVADARARTRARTGAGHRRPVNSGKLLVAWSRSTAALQSPRKTRSFHSGMRLPERTSVVTERDAAVHASRCLVAQCLQRQRAGRPRDSRRCVPRPAASARCAACAPGNRCGPASAHQSRACARSARRYSSGITLTKRSRSCGQVRSNRCATALPVSPAWRSRRPRTSSWSSTSERLERNRRAIAARREGPLLVEHVRDAAAHARREVAAGCAEHDHGAPGHVLAAVIADALDDGEAPRVADAEPFAGHAANECLAGGRTVERDVADDDVVLRAPRARRPVAGSPGGRRRAPCRRSRWPHRAASG